MLYDRQQTAHAVQNDGRSGARGCCGVSARDEKKLTFSCLLFSFTHLAALRCPLRYE